jgi:hypothetical protein
VTGLQGQIFVNNPLDVNENDEHALDFAFHMSRLSQSQSVWTSHLCMTNTFFSESLSNHGQGFCRTFSGAAQHLTHTCCQIHFEITLSQIHISK